MANRTDLVLGSVTDNSIITRISPSSPQTGASAAPVNHISHRRLHSSRGTTSSSSSLRGRSSPCSEHSASTGPSSTASSIARQKASSPSSVPNNPESLSSPDTVIMSHQGTPPTSFSIAERQRSGSRDTERSMMMPGSPLLTPTSRRSRVAASPKSQRKSPGGSLLFDGSDSLAKAKARSAQKQNDSMVYLDGPQVYTCGQCRTHLTSHDDIISKSFHGRHGRAYLFDQCVNITIGPAEDRVLITGLHSVSDIFCKRCKGMIGWTYAKAYEQSQKYKEGKYIIEKINLHLEESSQYDVVHPAGERPDRWRKRSMSWGSEQQHIPSSPRSPHSPGGGSIVYEYNPSGMSLPSSIEGLISPRRSWDQRSSLSSSENYDQNNNSSSNVSAGGRSLLRPSNQSTSRSRSASGPMPAPPFL